ncbi:MAG: penicillin-binding protein 2 [Chitinophagaceae bacterium]|nr:penicillin-binding protein 2 [Chitinophagaceae bacterium]MBP6415891.1 penicillin-binding protein 2 [Chitinophagaceae bacterium]HQW43299.1 penicillin-binding transpeptidase domain-containing protein [Chitinophagaceae bacterium]
MSVFNQSRSRIIRLIFLLAFVVIIIQLFYLQVVSDKFSRLADENAILRKTIYPPRGLILDRKGNAILKNILTYDLMVTPSQAKGIDTVFFCRLLEIDTAEYRKRIVNAIIKNKSFRPSVFEASLSPQKYARIQENLWRFQSGFYIQERPIRSYPYSAAANIFGYLGEVDTNYLKKHIEDGYVSGDYAGMTGLEASYEKALMGERGMQVLLKDNFNRIQGSYENGALDVEAAAGSNLYTSLDIELQQLGEKLMSNKVGSIVAIDPKTGSIIAMVSSPTYEPGYLTGPERRKHFSELYTDARLPLLNRAVNASYAPGSTFKTLQALVGLGEGVISTTTTFSCSGAFYGCGSGKPMGCLDPGTYYLKTGITHSCNTYFANVMQRVINNPKYPNVDSSLRAWNNYMYAFGLGHRLGVDVPTEQKGNIPTPEYFNNPKRFGPGKWNFCSFRSVSIGQGEVTATPLQVANEMAYIANKGWYYIPHIVDSIEGGDKFGLLDKYKQKVIPMNLADSIFEAVHDGMQGVMESGTGRGSKIPGIVVCGKTGTVENYANIKGQLVKQPNHSFFCAFAPRENPRIAIMCVVENSGRFGGTYAGPIVSLMIEKYINDTIDAKRKPLEERMASINLIPPLMKQKMRTKDSLQRVKEEEKALKNELKIIKDTLQSEDNLTEADIRAGKSSDNKQPRDTQHKKPVKTDIMAPEKQKESGLNKKDTASK